MIENAGNGGWSLSEDGIFWKRVLDCCSTPVVRDAELFIAQLQEAVGPVDALQGLLLDRIAAGCLRKWNLLLRKPDWDLLSKDDPRYPRAQNLLRYEGLLDRVFHRDLILLLQLKKMAPFAPALTPKKPPQSDRSIIEGEPDSSTADQGVGAIATAEPVERVVEITGEPSGRTEQDDFSPTVDLD